MRPRTAAVLGAAALLAAAVAGGLLLARDTGPAEPVAVRAGGPVVTLSGPDVRTGEAVTLERFAGRPVVIAIWASWCPGCNAEAPALARFAAANPDVGVVGVDFADTKGAALEFLDRYGWTFPSVFDPSGRIARELGLRGTPTTIFLDAGHREAARIVGETDEAGFAAALRRAT